jgi:hypothetical protein
MFSGLSKIFDKTFIVGFALPALLFVFGEWWILHLFGAAPAFLSLSGTDPLKDSTVLAIVALGIALALMVLNWIILRTLEGYWLFDLGYKLNVLQAHRWRSLRQKIEQLTAQRDECAAAGIPFPSTKQRSRLMEEFATNFPSKESLVLPTSFGNAIRAFEDYPRVMYRLDSIPAWSRLNGVISKDYRELMDGSRSNMDFWMNLWFLALVVLAHYAALAAWHWTLPRPWLAIPGLLLLIYFASSQATAAAIGWGEWVKGAFDLYLIELLKKLEFKPPSHVAELRELCFKLSQMMIYRETKPLDDIDRYREGYEQPKHLILPDDHAP